MTFDSRYRITENKLFSASNTIARYSYSYDSAGNILGIQDLIDGSYSRTFGYDDLNRLVTANTGTSLWRTGSYAYDAMGNMTSRSLGTPPVDDGTVLSLPGRHLRASAAVTGQVDRLSFTFQGTTPKIGIVTANGLDHTVSYDNAGNETGYYATRTYSPRNLMNSVTDTSGEGPAHSISYGYDYRGVRVSRTETPTDAGSASRYYFYSPELHLLDSTVDDSNNVWGQSAHIMSAPLVMNREVIWFNGQPVAEFGPPRTPDATGPLSLHHTFDTNTPANSLFYTFTDHLGTPLIQTDPSMAIVWRAEHEPYGNVYLMRKGARIDQPLRFPGQEAAMTWEGTEENYNVFRWYRGGWGRYTQADPISLRLSVWQPALISGLLLGYSSNNPVRFFDQNGLATSSCCDCPEKLWSYSGVSEGIGAVVGVSYSQGTYTCKSKPELKVKVKVTCVQVGLFAAVNFGSYDTSIIPIGVPAAKACKANELTDPDPTKSIFAGGKAGAGISGDVNAGTGVISIGLGAGLGGGGQTCWANPWN